MNEMNAFNTLDPFFPKEVPSRAEAKTIYLRDIGWAVRTMQEGRRVRRAGWNGKDMFLFLVPGSTFRVNRPPLLGIYPLDTPVSYHAHVDMRTASGEIVPWLCSQTDLLALDWELAP